MLNLRRNILIFHQAALGDFIITFPIALAMGRMFPQSRVMYVTANSKGKLAERLVGVDSIDIESGWHVLHGEKPDLNDRNRSIIEGAHTIISFVSKPNDLWEDNVRMFNPQATLVQLDTKPASDPNDDHIAQNLVKQLSRWPAISSAAAMMLNSVQTRGLTVRRDPSQIVIHPGAGNEQKRWPVEKFVKLIEMLGREGHSVKVLLGETELEQFSTDAIRSIDKAAAIAKPATYLELLEQLATAKVFIGNDSGPGHLAGIIATPTISLFGTPSTRWKPLGPNVHVIEKDSLAKITVDEVAQQARVLLESQAAVEVGAGDEDD